MLADFFTNSKSFAKNTRNIVKLTDKAVVVAFAPYQYDAIVFC